jgi:hypothetical protein
MKRTAGATDAVQSPKKHPRQDPVSCQNCRKRKLKCDRKRPCSGCSTRKLECVYNENGPETTATPETSDRRARGHTVDSIISPELRTVEEPAQDQDANESLKTTDWLETIVMGHWIPNAVPKALRTELLHGEQLGNTLQVQASTYGSRQDPPQGDDVM